MGGEGRSTGAMTFWEVKGMRERMSTKKRAGQENSECWD